MAHRNWKLSPSDFAFLWEECRRCFYLKIVQGFKRPSMPFPSIFGVIAWQMHSVFLNQRTETIAPEMPGGVVQFGEKWVHSEPIVLPNHADTCYIRGRFDAVARFDDGTYGLIDFKTSTVKSQHTPLYTRQLHAYTYALEHPAPGKFALDGPVSRLGLVVFEPGAFANEGFGLASMSGGLHWVEMPRDDDRFLAFLDEVLAVLELPEPPEAAPECGWCQYREASRAMGL